MKSNMSDAEYERWAEPRQHDKFYKSKVFWAGIAIIGASITLDAHSTARGFGQGYEEGNPFLGAHPSNGRIAAFSSLDFGAQLLLHYGAWRLSHNDPSKAWRTFGQWGVPAGVVATNGQRGIRNYRLQAKFP